MRHRRGPWLPQGVGAAGFSARSFRTCPRERESESERERVCVCVREREREKERECEREREIGRAHD